MKEVEKYYCVVVGSFYRLVALGHWASRCWNQNSTLGLSTMNPTWMRSFQDLIHFTSEHLAQDFLLVGREVSAAFISLRKLILLGPYWCKGLELSQVSFLDGVSRIRMQVILILINLATIYQWLSTSTAYTITLANGELLKNTYACPHLKPMKSEWGERRYSLSLF